MVAFFATKDVNFFSNLNFVCKILTLFELRLGLEHGHGHSA